MQSAAELTAETGSTVEGIALDIKSVTAINSFVDSAYVTGQMIYVDGGWLVN